MATIHTARLTIHTTSVPNGFFPATRSHLWLAVPRPLGPADWPVASGRVEVAQKLGAMLNHITVNGTERRHGYGMEIVLGLEGAFGKLRAGWMTTEGVSFARAFMERHGPREWFLSPHHRPEAESNEAATPDDMEQMATALEDARCGLHK